MSALPTHVEEFDADERISFSRLDNKFIAVHEDGNEYEFIADQHRWVIAEEGDEEIDNSQFSRERSSSAQDDNGSRKRKNGTDNGGVSFKVSKLRFPADNGRILAFCT